MSPEVVIDRFETWVRLGWMRPLEAQFVRFLFEREPGCDGRVLLAGGLVSHVLVQGHVSLDLESLVQDPFLWLALPPEQDRKSSADTMTSALRASAAEWIDAELRIMNIDDWQTTLRRSRLVAAVEGVTPLVLDGSRLYLRRNWAAAREVADDLSQRTRLTDSSISREQLAELFGLLFPSESNEDAPDWQKIACAVSLRYRFSIITGGPGTGKTWTMVKLLTLLQAVNQIEGHGRPLRVRLAAPTGKAAARMTESVRNSFDQLPERFRDERWRPEDASTLHRLLGSRRGTKAFRHQRHDPVPADVVIVDEASMIDLQMMQSLVRGLDLRTRLVLLGDKDQLDSVEPGSVFGDLCRGADRSAFDPDLAEWLRTACGESVEALADGEKSAADRVFGIEPVMLRKAHRFNEAIASLAEVVNAGESDRAVELLDAGGREVSRIGPESPDDTALRQLLVGDGSDGYAQYLDVVRAPRWLNPGETSLAAEMAKRPEELEQWARECLEAFSGFQVLTGTHHGAWGVDETNRRIRRWLVDRSLIDATGAWFHGRPVLITRNNYRTGLMNGDIGLCLRWPLEGGGTALRVVFQKADGALHILSTTRVADCRTAWAMTVHKSQGSEFGHTVLILPDRPSRVLTRELIYTGLTRARTRFTLVAPDQDVFRNSVEARAWTFPALVGRSDDGGCSDPLSGNA